MDDLTNECLEQSKNKKQKAVYSKENQMNLLTVEYLVNEKVQRRLEEIEEIRLLSKIFPETNFVKNSILKIRNYLKRRSK